MKRINHYTVYLDEKILLFSIILCLLITLGILCFHRLGFLNYVKFTDFLSMLIGIVLNN